MASTLKLTNVPVIRTWAQAQARFHKTEPVRGADPNWRPLDTRSCRDRWLIQRGDTYAVRYHDTDIITFRPDGTIHLNPYPSTNTDLLVHAVTEIDTRYYRRGDNAMYIALESAAEGGKRLYRLSAHARRHGFLVTAQRPQLVNPAQDTQPIAWYGLDRKRSAQVMKDAGLTSFMTWVKAAWKLAPQAFVDPTRMRGMYLTNMPVEALARCRTPTEWPTLIQEYGPQVLARMRVTALLQDPRAFTCEEHPSVLASEYDNLYKAKRQYKDGYDLKVARGL